MAQDCPGPLVSPLGLMEALVRTLLYLRRVGAVPGRNGLVHSLIGEPAFRSFDLLGSGPSRSFLTSDSRAPMAHKQQPLPANTRLPPFPSLDPVPMRRHVVAAQ
jgi:hypothetical protein